jgi:hypothetical protein
MWGRDKNLQVSIILKLLNRENQISLTKICIAQPLILALPNLQKPYQTLKGFFHEGSTSRAKPEQGMNIEQAQTYFVVIAPEDLR